MDFYFNYFTSIGRVHINCGLRTEDICVCLFLKKVDFFLCLRKTQKWWGIFAHFKEM